MVLRASRAGRFAEACRGSLRFGSGQDLDAVGGGQPGEAGRVGRDGYGQAQVRADSPAAATFLERYTSPQRNRDLSP